MKYALIEGGCVMQVQPYPESGFVGVPDDVVPGFHFDGQSYAAPQKTEPSVEDRLLAIKAEARRRILLIMNEDKQRNTLAAGMEATMTYGADPANWPPELQQRQAEAMTAWAEIERLRARSDKIELMDPLPEDVTEDGLWAEQTE